MLQLSTLFQSVRRRLATIVQVLVFFALSLTLPFAAQAATFSPTPNTMPWTITGGAFPVIYAIAPLSDGSVYLGGNFTAVDGVSRNGLAHILADGSLDLGWSADISGSAASVYSLLVDADNGIVYVGGDFTTIGGVSRQHIAAVTTSTGAVTTWNSNANADVRGLALDATSSILYVAGDFTNIGGQSRSYVASLDTSVNTSTATAWDSGVNFTSESLVLDSSTGILYVGGGFSIAGGAGRNNIAAFDTATGLVTNWNPNANNVVKTLALDASNHVIYAGGFFTTVSGVSHKKIVALDTTLDVGMVLGWSGLANSANNHVEALALDPFGDLYVGGWFTSMGGSSRSYFAAVSTSTGLATSWNPNLAGGSPKVFALAFNSSHDKLYAGGEFTSIGGDTSFQVYAEFSVLPSPGITVTESSATTNVTEGGSTDTYTVVLDAQPTSDVTITLTSDSHVTTSASTLTFTNLNWDTPQSVTVTAVDDDIVQGSHTGTITHAVTSADVNYDGLAASDVVATVTDNDTAGIIVGSISGNTTEAGGTATFTIVLNSEPTADVTIGVSSDDTTEGTVSPSTFAFTSSNWDTPQTVIVTGADDVAVDGSITYSIVLAAASSLDSNYDALNPTDVTVVNTDNDTSGGGGGGGCGALCSPYGPFIPSPIRNTQASTDESNASGVELLKGLQSIGIAIHSLLKLPDDGNPETQFDSAVYYVGADGRRHAFPNERVFFSWYPDFGGVQIINDAQLASIPLGKNVTYKPGVRMVKLFSDSKVYAVSKKAVLRWVKTQEVAEAMYGLSWRKQIDDIADTFYDNYQFGPDIVSPTDYDAAAAQASVVTISDNLW